MSLTEQICEKARDLGFDLVGIAPASPPPHLHDYYSWLAQGYHGEMGYLARPDRVERRGDPAKILPGARSILCVGLNYYPGALPAHLRRDPSRGLISNYAWGLDYHDLMIPRLEELATFVGIEVGDEIRNQVFRKKPFGLRPPLRRRPKRLRAKPGFSSRQDEFQNILLINYSDGKPARMTGLYQWAVEGRQCPHFVTGSAVRLINQEVLGIGHFSNPL